MYCIRDRNCKHTYIYNMYVIEILFIPTVLVLRTYVYIACTYIIHMYTLFGPIKCIQKFQKFCVSSKLKEFVLLDIICICNKSACICAYVLILEELKYVHLRMCPLYICMYIHMYTPTYTNTYICGSIHCIECIQ